MPERPNFNDPRNTPHGFYGENTSDGPSLRLCSCGFATASRDEWWYHRFEECAGRTRDDQQEGSAAFTQATAASAR